MKKISIIFATVILSGCGPGFSSAECFMSVKNKYIGSEVSPIPKNDFSFLVRKQDGTVLIAKTMDFDTKVTEEIIIFGANK